MFVLKSKYDMLLKENKDLKKQLEKQEKSLKLAIRREESHISRYSTLDSAFNKLIGSLKSLKVSK